MSTYKRRIVYLSDPEWSGLAALAQKRKLTISATIRDMLVDPVPDAMRKALQPDVAKFPAGGVQARQAQRDALLSKINRGKG